MQLSTTRERPLTASTLQIASMPLTERGIILRTLRSVLLETGKKSRVRILISSFTGRSPKLSKISPRLRRREAGNTTNWSRSTKTECQSRKSKQKWILSRQQRKHQVRRVVEAAHTVARRSSMWALPKRIHRWTPRPGELRRLGEVRQEDLQVLRMRRCTAPTTFRRSMSTNMATVPTACRLLELR